MKPSPRAEQIGSLRRPRELLEARFAARRGDVTPERLTALEDEAILRALERQRATGVEILSDGELRRAAWQTGISDACEGFVADYPIGRQTLPDGTVVELELHTKAIESKLRQHRRMTEHESRFLLDHAGGPFKITMPSPHNVAYGGWQQGLTDRVYLTREELFADLIPIYQREVVALADEGVNYIQFDEGFTRYVRPEARDAIRASGMDPEVQLIRDIDVENAIYDELAEREVTLGSHLCRGSRTVARGDGGYDWLAERLFDQLHADRFLFEYDHESVGGFEPLRFLPAGKTVVLGLVTSKDPRLENQDELIRKIEEAAAFCSLEQLALSPQCGFGGSADNDFMTEDEQWRKLENLSNVARRIWGE